MKMASQKNRASKIRKMRQHLRFQVSNLTSKTDTERFTSIYLGFLAKDAHFPLTPAASWLLPRGLTSRSPVQPLFLLRLHIPPLSSRRRESQSLDQVLDLSGVQKTERDLGDIILKTAEVPCLWMAHKMTVLSKSRFPGHTLLRSSLFHAH